MAAEWQPFASTPHYWIRKCVWYLRWIKNSLIYQTIEFSCLLSFKNVMVDNARLNRNRLKFFVIFLELFISFHFFWHILRKKAHWLIIKRWSCFSFVIIWVRTWKRFFIRFWLWAPDWLRWNWPFETLIWFLSWFFMRDLRLASLHGNQCFHLRLTL